ncbi:hypothetical protein LIER_08338 [Lithospermum erythrorhizon]|uniref:Uncharacterized protein n=1 Tax=Lithospermum erythrorhizon TaxID=34254 RepID=A0AAV3PCD2_LITER
MHEGKPSVIFKRSDEQRYLSMMKHVGLVCVELDVSKPLMKETWVSFVDDEDPSIVVDGFWKMVEYDDVPPYCSKCLHMRQRLEDCKCDLDKEQGKGQTAPYINRRRPYRRVVNPAKSEIQKGLDNAIDDERGLDGLERGAEVDENYPPIDRLETGVEGASIPLDQDQRKEVDSSLAEDNNIPIYTKRDAENVPSLEGLMVVPKDFQEPMGTATLAFTASNAPSSPKSITRVEALNGSREGVEESVRNLEECQVSLDSLDSRSPETYQTGPICLSKEAVAGEKFLPVSIIEKCIQNCNLIDAGFMGSKYTWNNGKLSQRLDRVLCDQLCLDKFLVIELKLLHDTPKGVEVFNDVCYFMEGASLDRGFASTVLTLLPKCDGPMTRK